MSASSHPYAHELLQLSNNGVEIQMWETEGFIIQKAFSRPALSIDTVAEISFKREKLKFSQSAMELIGLYCCKIRAAGFTRT